MEQKTCLKCQKSNNPEFVQKVSKYKKEYRKKNSETIKEKQRIHHAERQASDPEYVKNRNKISDAWYQENKDRVRDNGRERDRIKRQTDIQFKIKKNLRSRIYTAINRGKKRRI